MRAGLEGLWRSHDELVLLATICESNIQSKTGVIVTGQSILAQFPRRRDSDIGESVVAFPLLILAYVDAMDF